MAVVEAIIAATDRARLLFATREHRRILTLTLAENRKQHVDLFEIAFEIDDGSRRR